jgi:transketolase
MIQPIDIRDAFFDELYEIAREDDSVIFMTADMGAFSLERFRRDFPDRFINVGIAEQNMVSVAAGMALEGKKVFIYAIIPFVTLRCLEQIKVDLCVMNLPVVIVGAGAGFTYSNDGPTHHALEDVSVMRALPGMTIYNPSDQISAKYSARNALLASGPVYVRLDKGIFPLLHDESDDLSAGVTLLKGGEDLLIIASGCMTYSAMQIANSLESDGINAGVADVFRLKPIDPCLSELIKRFKAIVTIEEHILSGGFGSSVLELMADAGILSPVKRFGITGYPEGYGDREWMRNRGGIALSSIKDDIRSFLMSTKRSMTVDDFVRSFDTTLEEMPEECIDIITSTNFNYSNLEEKEKDQLVLDILKRIDADRQIIAAPEREAAWNKGWSENLRDFIDSGYDTNKLIPKFVRPSSIVRLFGDYVKVEDCSFEHNYIKVLRTWLFKKYFGNYETIYEFGSGTGHNLLELARLYPHKHLIGLDFVESSCELIATLGKVTGYNISSKLFNMITPDESYKLADNSLIFTFGVIEQLGSNFHQFTNYLLSNSPGLCVHIEPTLELYNDESLSDYLAVKFHTKRKYTVGYLPYLRQLEQRGIIEVFKVKRLFFGSLMMEGYNLILWKPKGGVCGLRN